MHVVAWRYRVAAGREADFERLYGTGGDWARLFRRSSDYLGTDLYRDTAHVDVYLTLDRWTSRAAYDDFLRHAHDDYAALDARGDALTVEEECLGTLAE